MVLNKGTLKQTNMFVDSSSSSLYITCWSCCCAYDLWYLFLFFFSCRLKAVEMLTVFIIDYRHNLMQVKIDVWSKWLYTPVTNTNWRYIAWIEISITNMNSWFSLGHTAILTCTSDRAYQYNLSTRQLYSPCGVHSITFPYCILNYSAQQAK